MSLLAERYARALFEVAEPQGAVDAVAHDLARLRDLFADEQARDALLDPRVPGEQRLRALTTLLAGSHPLTGNLLGAVLRRRREAILPELHAAFMTLVHRARNEITGVVESAKPLGDDQLEHLQRVASETFHQKVTLTQRVEPELIGGIRVRVGNTLYDGSVATALEELERRLMEAPVP